MRDVLLLKWEKSLARCLQVWWRQACKKGWKAAMKPGQRYLAPNIQISKLKAGEYFVEKIYKDCWCRDM
jgi:hypothetical protein